MNDALQYAPADVQAVLLGYQRQLMATTAEVVLVEKSRRVGISWTAACDGATVSSLDRDAAGMDTLYIGYNLEMAREFIDDAAFWLKHLHGFAAEVEEFVFEDTDADGTRAIKSYRITLASGFEIKALSSRPRSLRGMQGFVIIDEAAFHDDLPGLMKAAMAMLMWGGKVLVISTHDGADNYFNDLIEDARAGRNPYKVLRITFDDAVAQGLYKRICLVTKKPWSPEAEAEWCAKIRDFYGEDAPEELDVIPSAGSGVWLTGALIKACMSPRHRVVYLECPDGFELEPDHHRHGFVEAWLQDYVDPLIAELDDHSLGHLGGDFARSGDLSVFMPGQIFPNTQKLVVPFAVELRNVPFREQEQILYHVIEGIPRFVAAALDARGLGQMIAELAMQKYGANRIAQVMATIAWYRENMPGLKARFEDQIIELPLDDDIRQDLRMVKLNKGVPMIPEGARVRSTRGGRRHGDAAIALAMLHFATTMDVAPIEFAAAGSRRAAMAAYGERSHEISHGRGFGTVGGANDFKGYV